MKLPFSYLSARRGSRAVFSWGLALALGCGGSSLGQEAPPPLTGPLEPSAADAPPPSQPLIPEAQAAPALPALEDASPLHQAWHEDYQVARMKAIEEDKHLLLVFTGSDWIPICQIFDRDLLNQPDFVDAVSEDFVLVRLDFPKDRRLSPAIAAQNQLFLRAYRVTGFPTVFLTDTEGRPYGINGYQAVTPANYGKIILAMRQMGVIRDQYFAKAEEAEGVEKARLLSQGVPDLPGNLTGRYYAAQLEAIIANDPGDETGKVEKCKRLLADVRYADEMQRLEQAVEWSRMLDLTDAHIREGNLQGQELQQALFNKVSVFEKQGLLPEVVRALLEIVAIDKESPHGRRAQGALDRLRAQKLEEDLSPR